MTDYTHLSNIIQGAVIQIRERRAIQDQPQLLDDLSMFLIEEGWKIGQAKEAAMDDLRKAYVDMLDGEKP